MPKYANFDIHFIDADIGTAETTVAHGMSRVPVDAFIFRRGGSANIFRGPTAWDSTNIYLQASVAIRVRLGII